MFWLLSLPLLLALPASHAVSIGYRVVMAGPWVTIAHNAKYFNQENLVGEIIEAKAIGEDGERQGAFALR